MLFVNIITKTGHDADDIRDFANAYAENGIPFAVLNGSIDSVIAPEFQKLYTMLNHLIDDTLIIDALIVADEAEYGNVMAEYLNAEGFEKLTDDQYAQLATAMRKDYSDKAELLADALTILNGKKYEVFSIHGNYQSEYADLVIAEDHSDAVHEIEAYIFDTGALIETVDTNDTFNKYDNFREIPFALDEFSEEYSGDLNPYDSDSIHDWLVRNGYIAKNGIATIYSNDFFEELAK